MKLIDRLLINHLELGIHPKIGAFFIEIALLGLATRIRFSFYALKKAFRTKLTGFYIDEGQKCCIVTILGIDMLFWVYSD